MSVEHLKLLVPTIAIVGAIVLGYHNPDKYSATALAVLSGAVGGYFGAASPTTTTKSEVPGATTTSVTSPSPLEDNEL